MPDGDHQMVNITLAGVKSPRVSTKQGESSEPLGEEVGLIGIQFRDLLTFISKAKFFTESRLLQRHVKVEILSLPNAGATPFQSSSTFTAPPPASVCIGTGLH
jgi:staphylococcal nuclease domain-containing protein 1